MENLVFCSGISLLFFKNYKMGLLRARSMALAKHVAHYGPWPGFPYYNLTDLPTSGPPLSATWCSCWVSSGDRALETSTVPCEQKEP